MIDPIITTLAIEISPCSEIVASPQRAGTSQHVANKGAHLTTRNQTPSESLWRNPYKIAARRLAPKPTPSSARGTASRIRRGYLQHVGHNQVGALETLSEDCRCFWASN
jgi:hypothetical protein